MSIQPVIRPTVSIEDDPALTGGAPSPGSEAGNVTPQPPYIPTQIEEEPEDEGVVSVGSTGGANAGRGGAATNAVRNPSGNRIVDEAMKYIGTPYKWGGTGAGGIDCSGLTSAAYRAAGINLPRVSFQQARGGRRVAFADLQPGDLVAWDNSPRNPGADHIAIYAGNGMIIEAPRAGLNVRMRKLGASERNAWGVRY